MESNIVISAFIGSLAGSFIGISIPAYFISKKIQEKLTSPMSLLE